MKSKIDNNSQTVNDKIKWQANMCKTINELGDEGSALALVMTDNEPSDGQSRMSVGIHGSKDDVMRMLSLFLESTELTSDFLHMMLEQKKLLQKQGDTNEDKED